MVALFRFNVVLSRQAGYNPKDEVGPDGNPDDVILCKSLQVGLWLKVTELVTISFDGPKNQF